MSTGKTGRCPVSPFYICLVSAEDICPVSAADICPVSTADICPVSKDDIYPVSTEDTMFKSQKRGLALDWRKWSEMGPERSPGLENPPK